MAVRAYAGSARPVDSVYEGRAGFRVVEWDHADGSILRGYQRLADGALIGGACFVVSPARQAELDVLNTAEATRKAGDAAFMADLEQLALKVRDNLATAAETRRCTWKLFRAVRGILRDND
jgi:hypothetical protein